MKHVVRSSEREENVLIGFDRVALYRIFESLDRGCKSKQTLCLIGAAAILASGHTLRLTQDIDVWRPASRINDRDLARAAEIAGIKVNPSDLAVDQTYLQIISPGIVQLPAYNRGRWATGARSDVLWQGDFLTVVAPPAEIIVATKLARGEDRDLEDCVYLMEAKRLKLADIEAAIAFLPDVLARDAATENIILVSVIGRGSTERGGRKDS